MFSLGEEEELGCSEKKGSKADVDSMGVNILQPVHL
jgi:hypothetical protein